MLTQVLVSDLNLVFPVKPWTSFLISKLTFKTWTAQARSGCLSTETRFPLIRVSNPWYRRNEEQSWLQILFSVQIKKNNNNLINLTTYPEICPVSNTMLPEVRMKEVLLIGNVLKNTTGEWATAQVITVSASSFWAIQHVIFLVLKCKGRILLRTACFLNKHCLCGFWSTQTTGFSLLLRVPLHTSP